MSVTNDIATDQRVNRIALSLCKLNASVTIVGRKRKQSLLLSSSYLNYKRFSLLFNKGPLFYACYNIRLFKYLLFQRFDILVANDLDTLPANYLVSKLTKVKLVYDSHEYFTEVPELVGRERVKRIWEAMERWMLPKISYSYTVCQSIADIYNKKYGTAMQVIRNLPNRNTDSEIIERISSGNDKIILYQGSVNIGRGIEPVIEAMKYLDHIKFVIIGEGDIKNQLEDLVKKLGVQDKVIFLGRIAADKLASYTCQADIGISLEENLGLSYYYALPNKLFDYIQAGIPVLVSNFPEMGNLVKKYNIGKATLVTQPEELSIILETMLNDKVKLKLWKENTKKAAAELCWDNEEKKLLDFYTNLI